MPKIDTVDYEKIPTHAKQIRKYGEELNKELTDAYNRVELMHKNWYGKRYNSLVESFNGIVTEINDLLDLVVSEIPWALETVANNYSKADSGKNITSAQKTAPKKITNIPISNDVGMRFVTNAVENYKNLVSKNFKNAKTKMNTIATEYSKITWKSEASEAFKSKFTKLKNNITKALDDIDAQFTKLMNEALSDVQSAEKANTVS